MSSPEGGEPIVSIKGVSKKFPGVLAVDGVDLDLLPGEVHVLAGENGAGKSTLMKLLSQVEAPTSGEIRISGEPVEFHGPRHAQNLGVAMVYQEFALAPHLSVAQNLFMGREPGRFGFLDRRSELREAQELLKRVGVDINAGRLVSSLVVAEQQRVEIAKALAIDAKVMILDEPSATLTEREIDELFEVIEDLKSQGIAVLYISHRLDEIFRIGDRVTIMRDGQVVDTVPTGELDEEKLINLMSGLWRVATRAPMYRTALTGALPPHTSRFPTSRFPRKVPESRLKGATPTSAESRLWVSVPSSGSSAKNVLASTGPTPGTLRKSASFSLKTVLASTASSSSSSVRSSSFWSHLMCARMRLATVASLAELEAIPRRLFSAVCISKS